MGIHGCGVGWVRCSFQMLYNSSILTLPLLCLCRKALNLIPYDGHSSVSYNIQLQCQPIYGIGVLVKLSIGHSCSLNAENCGIPRVRFQNCIPDR